MLEPRKAGAPFRKSTLIHTILGLLLPLWMAAIGLYVIETAPIVVDQSLRDTFDEKLAKEKPEIVILGNSITFKGVDEKRLEQRLGREVSLLTIPSSEAPGWYAVLKNRVYAQGYTPETIIVVNAAVSLLSTEASSGKDLEFLEQMIETDEPVLGGKVLYKNADNLRFANLNRRRSLIRRAILDGWRDAMGHLATGSEASIQAASNTVFADGQLNYGLSTVKAPPHYLVKSVPPADSLLPDLIDLTDAHGSRFYFATVPNAPGSANPTTARVLRETITMLNERDAGYVGLNIEFGALEFEDVMHLNPHGRNKFTEYLADRLLDLGVNNAGPIPKAAVPYATPSLTRTGELARSIVLDRTNSVAEKCGYVVPLDEFAGLGPEAILASGLPPSLPWEVFFEDTPLEHFSSRRSLLRTCDAGQFVVRKNQLAFVPPDAAGESFDLAFRLNEAATVTSSRGDISWVYPGTSLVIESTEPWDDERGPMTIRVYAHPFGGGDGIPTVQLNSRPPVAMDDYGAQRVARLQSPKDKSQWRVVIHSPDDGPFLALHGLKLGRDDAEIDFFNSGRSTSLLAFNILGRNYAATRLTHHVYPPSVPGKPKLTWTDTGIGVYSAAAVVAVSDRKTGRSSPVAVLEDGVTLKRHQKCEDVDLKPGTQCHTGHSIRFHPSDSGGQHDYALVIDRTPNPARRRQFWLLPGDRMEVKFGSADLSMFVEGPDVFEVTAEAYPHADITGRVWLTLRQGDEVLVRERYTPKQLEAGVKVVLKERVSPTTQKMSLELHNKAGIPLLFQKATLMEHVGVRQKPAPKHRKKTAVEAVEP